LNFYQRFKWAVVARFSHRSWILTSEQIDLILQKIREAEPLLEGVT